MDSFVYLCLLFISTDRLFQNINANENILTCNIHIYKLCQDKFVKIGILRESKFYVVIFTVTPALAEPLPGWVDNLNGPVGIMVGAGKGVIRSMLCNGNYHAEMIPVDFAINSLIAIAHKTATNEK